MNAPKTMSFKEFWHLHKTPPAELARRTGLHYFQIYTLIKKGYTSFKVAAAIEIYSEGLVPCMSMLKKETLNELKEHHKRWKDEKPID